jgi:hypothetical protein
LQRVHAPLQAGQAPGGQCRLRGELKVSERARLVRLVRLVRLMRRVGLRGGCGGACVCKCRRGGMHGGDGRERALGGAGAGGVHVAVGGVVRLRRESVQQLGVRAARVVVLLVVVVECVVAVHRVPAVTHNLATTRSASGSWLPMVAPHGWGARLGCPPAEIPPLARGRTGAEVCAVRLLPSHGGTPRMGCPAGVPASRDTSPRQGEDRRRGVCVRLLLCSPFPTGASLRSLSRGAGAPVVERGVEMRVHRHRAGAPPPGAGR